VTETRIRAIVRDSVALKERFFSEQAGLLVQVATYLTETLRGGHKLLVFGNGGSAADAQHFAAELVGRYLKNRRGLPALALTTDPSIVTAVGNDLGFDQIFARQVEAHGLPGDVVIAISTSGRSPNVLAALRLARERGLGSVGLTGNGGGLVRDLVDHLIDVPSADTPRVQEVHGMVVHILCELVEEAFVS
jgi:D-sedoheptulose 7-phosphate isomerase